MPYNEIIAHGAQIIRLKPRKNNAYYLAAYNCYLYRYEIL